MMYAVCVSKIIMTQLFVISVSINPCSRDFIVHQISVCFFTFPILLCSKCESHMSRLDSEIVKFRNDL